MIWRRVQVTAATTLRELHGVFQVAMGWEGIHLYGFTLRAVHYGSPELGWRAPDIALADLQLRNGARFTYEYDLNIPWDHEVRLEDRLQSEARRTYPYCVDGNASCPPEDCGGPAGFLERRDERYSTDGLEDLATMADFLRDVASMEQIERLSDEDLIDEMRGVLGRIELRQSWEGKPFSSKAVNERLKSGEHLDLMHQQW
jgi:hypothetical protein